MHHTEYKAKILDINADSFRKKMKALGVNTYIKKMLKRSLYNTDSEDRQMLMELKDDGDNVTLTVKDVFGDDLGDEEESEIAVDNFEKAQQMLNKLGYTPLQYQEHKRITFKIEDTEVHVDYWPNIPPYAEIIGRDSESVEKVVEKLGHKPSEAKPLPITKVYKKYGINLQDIKDLRFKD